MEKVLGEVEVQNFWRFGEVLEFILSKVNVYLKTCYARNMVRYR